MGRRETIPVQRKMSADELEQRIKTLEKDTRVLKRLYFIRYRYEGDSVETAAEKVGVSALPDLVSVSNSLPQQQGKSYNIDLRFCVENSDGLEAKAAKCGKKYIDRHSGS